MSHLARLGRLPAPFPPGHGFPMCHGKQANHFDACLAQDTAVWHTIQCCGGITGLCKRASSIHYSDDEPPWVRMPQQGRRYQEINTVALALFPLATDITVVAFQVPMGYDGVIMGNVNRFIGPGFVEGSGDIEWRIQLSRRYAPDYGQILTSLGDLQAPTSFSSGGIRIYSHEVIRYIARVNNVAFLDPNGRILCALYGWFYPRP